MSHVEALASGTELVGDFRVDKVLGAGGFGITYLARETALDRFVTIKEYFPGDFAARRKLTAVPRSGDCAPDYEWGLERFISEAQTLAKFDHPNIVRVYRYFRANNTAYMVLHFEDGQSLKGWLTGLKRAPRQAELDKIVAPLLDALTVIHASEFLHRDIAPDNIIVRPDGSPVLIDFGAARGDIAQHSRTVSALVKPGYSPYEQYAELGKQQGPWTDIYAFAATLYHATTGKRPPDAPSRIVKDELVPAREAAVSAYRARFLKAIDRGLRLDIEKRPQSIAAWRGDLLAPEENAERGWFQSRRARGADAAQDGGDAAEVAKTRVLSPEESALADAVPPPPDAPGRRGRIVDFLDGVRRSPRATVLAKENDQAVPEKLDKAEDQAKPASPKEKPGAAARDAAGETPAMAGGLFTRLAKGLVDEGKPGPGPAARQAGKARQQARAQPQAQPQPRKAGKVRQGARIAPPRAAAKRRPAPPVQRRISRRGWLTAGARLAAGIAVAVIAVQVQQALVAPGRNASGRWARLPPLPAMAPQVTGSIARSPYRRAGVSPGGSDFEAAIALRAAIAGASDAEAGQQAADPTRPHAGEGFAASASLAVPGQPAALLLKTFAAHEGGTVAVRFANNGQALVSVGWDGALKVWDAKTFALKRRIDLDDGPALSLAVMGERALTGHENGQVGLWHLDLGMKLKSFKRNDAPVSSLAVAGPQRFLAGASDWSVALWDLTNSSFPLHTFQGHERDVLGVTYNATAGLIASVSADRTAKLWEAKSLSLERTYPVQRSFITAVAIAPDGQSLLFGTLDGRLAGYPTDGRRREMRYRGHDGRVTALTFIRGGGQFVSASEDGTVRLWDEGRSVPRQTFGSAGAQVKSVAVSPDGRIVAAAKANGTVQIWNAAAVE